MDKTIIRDIYSSHKTEVNDHRIKPRYEDWNDYCRDGMDRPWATKM